MRPRHEVTRHRRRCQDWAVNGSRLFTLLKPRRQQVTRFPEGLNLDLGPAYYRHEVGVAAPAGHYMEVNMWLDARSGRGSDIGPEVETASLHLTAHDGHGPADQVKHLQLHRRFQVIELGYVPVRGDQDVPVVVGVQVHHYEGVLPPIDDEILPVIAAAKKEKEEAQG